MLLTSAITDLHSVFELSRLDGNLPVESQNLCVPVQAEWREPRYQLTSSYNNAFQTISVASTTALDSVLWRRDCAKYNVEFVAAIAELTYSSGYLYCCWAEGCRFDSLSGWLRATQHSGCNSFRRDLILVNGFPQVVEQGRTGMAKTSGHWNNRKIIESLPLGGWA